MCPIFCDGYLKEFLDRFIVNMTRLLVPNFLQIFENTKNFVEGQHYIVMVCTIRGRVARVRTRQDRVGQCREEQRRIGQHITRRDVT